MKKNIILSMLVAALFVSCSDDELVPNTTHGDVTNIPTTIYPLASNTRANDDFGNNWENYSTIILNSGKTANMPWSESDANLPIQMAYDIKKEDGWVMLLHTFTGSNRAEDVGTNYMFLYNHRTGLLKVLYYLEPGFTWANNNGFWSFEFPQDHSYFNHWDEVALPMDVNQFKNFASSNASKRNDLSFRAGWNGFQVQLTYDDCNEIDEFLVDIESWNYNTANIDLYGEFDAYSSGALVTHGTKNPLSSMINSTASMFGEKAMEYITDYLNISDSDSTNTRLSIGGIITSVGKSLLSWGATTVLNALTAGFTKPTTTTVDVQINTKISGKFAGNIEFNTNAPCKTYRPNISTASTGTHLGVWNLASAPTIYIHPLADRTSDYFNGTEFNYKLRGITGYNYDLRINPELEKHLVKHWVDIDIVRYVNKRDSTLLNPINNFNYGSLSNPNGSLGNYNQALNYIYNGDEEGKDKIVLDDMKAVVYMREGLYNRYGQSPTVISLPNEAMYMAGNMGYPMEDRYLRFSLFLVTEFEGKRDTTLHTRTFVPKVEWDPVLYQQYHNYSQY